MNDKNDYKIKSGRGFLFELGHPGWSRMSWLVICAGVILRLKDFISNRSLWIDEAMLSLSIVDRSFFQLLKPLDYEQGAPVGFLLVEKLMTVLFGNNEFALRLFPLAAGALSLFLFYSVVNRCFNARIALVGLCLIAFSKPMIYYSSELKQYSVDAMVTLLVLLSTLRYVQSGRSMRGLALLAITGMVGMFFSHPAVFVLAGVGLVLLIESVIASEWKTMRSIALCCGIWTFIFIFNYFLFLKTLHSYTDLLSFHQKSFLPFPPWSLSDFSCYKDAFLESIPFGVPLRKMAAVVFLLGCVSLFRTRKRWLGIIVFPILYAAVASMTEKYPFVLRLLLFSVPLLSIGVAFGVEQLLNRSRKFWKAVGIAIVILLIVPAMGKSLRDILRRTEKEEIKPILTYVISRSQPQDTYYVYYAAQYAFAFYTQYSGRYELKEGDVITGIKSRNDPLKYYEDLDKVKGRDRVWIVFSHIWRKSRNSSDEEHIFLNHLEKIGKRLDQCKAPGSSAYLYSFAEK